MAEPWGAPAFMWISVDSDVWHLILAVLFVRKFDIHLMKLMGKLSCTSLSLSPSCHMVSKAFWTSSAVMTAVKPLFIVACSIGVRTRSSWSVISMPGLKPAWLSGSEFCMMLENFFVKIFSKSLEIVLVRLMGLYDWGSPGFLFGLGNIKMWASFQRGGR
jgi:hypothetical protein